ncbi:radical SAM protein [Thermosipho sp. 1063]|uniref:radical SAM/SPASM domain-containing protein n=1 Tax=unclassified Thermosipho (in: thermotogales) TaxID=2676525 RepID=UPI0009493B92|nr:MULTISPECIES: radical SAM protein [unclassified Thermosipho (in: thermotogales)]ANQ54453.1 radical SAM protein [Thermosipho sp. 1070]APT72897.1 radical SAM protein [Thermosipho sp. 1063]OOC42335.1 radical SAM protein [Thermosipho sp. 1074]
MEFKLISHFGKHLLFLPEHLLLFEIDEELFSFFENKSTLPESIKKEIFKYLPIKQKNEFTKTVEEKYDINAIVLTVSHECNLNCKYCYGNNGTYGNPGVMDFETAKRAIETFFDKGQSNVGITFFGGEPLLNFKLIKQVTKFAKEYIGRNVKFGMTTNGILIKDDVACFLTNNDFSVLISLDGDQFYNDKLRYTKAGKGTHNTILNSIKKLLLYNTNGRVSIRATLTSINNDLIELVGYFSSLDLPFTIQLVTTNDEDLRPTFEELSSKINDFGKYITDLVRDRNYKQAFKKTFGWMNLAITVVHGKNKRFYPCGGGRKVLVVNPMGDVYICHRMDGNNNGKVGNIFEDTREDIIENTRRLFSEKLYTVDHLQDCSNCWAKYICGGRCYHESLITANEWNTVDKLSCHFKKKLFELGLVIYAYLPDKLKDNFSKANKSEVVS